MEEISLKSPFGKSDLACNETEVKVKLDVDYISRQQRNWFKLSKELVSDNNDWDYV